MNLKQFTPEELDLVNSKSEMGRTLWAKEGLVSFELAMEHFHKGLKPGDYVVALAWQEKKKMLVAQIVRKKVV